MNILVVGGDQDALADVCDALKEDGHCAEIVDTLAEAFTRDDLPAFSVVLLDRSLSNDSQHLHLLRLKAPDAAVIIITGYADLGDTIEALRLGAVDYLVKPRQPEWLRRCHHTREEAAAMSVTVAGHAGDDPDLGTEVSRREARRRRRCPFGFGPG